MRGVCSKLVAGCVIALLAACHADDLDPKGQAEELNDPVRREHAIGQLTLIFAQRLQVAKGDRSQPGLKQFADVTSAQLVKTYLEHPEDTQNGLRILSLLAEMRDPRALPALLKALEWRRDVSEEHAVTGAVTMTQIDVPEGDKAKVVEKICQALERVEDARGVDNRMRKSFIEVLGKLKDKRATKTLTDVMLRQQEQQNFLFNILAAQQFIELKDPDAIPALIQALYLADPNNPAMRMTDVVPAALVALGKPALDPMLKVLRGEDETANKTVDAYIAAVRRKDPDAAAAMLPRAILSGDATYALGKLGFREALDPLIEESKADDDTRRFGAALALVSVQREPADTPRIIETMKRVFDSVKKTSRPQMMVAVRHLYAVEAIPFLLKVASTPEDEVPEIRLWAFAGCALLANKAEVGPLKALLDKEEDFKTQLEEYRPALVAAEECDESVECWMGKLKDKDKIVLRKASSMLARLGRGNAKAVDALLVLFGHRDLEVRNEALAAVDFIAVGGSKAAVDKISELERVEGGRSIWNNFKREALPTRSRILLRGAN